MEFIEEKYEHIAPLLPVRRGNMGVSNLQTLDAIPYTDKVRDIAGLYPAPRTGR